MPGADDDFSMGAQALCVPSLRRLGEREIRDVDSNFASLAEIDQPVEGGAALRDWAHAGADSAMRAGNEIT